MVKTFLQGAVKGRKRRGRQKRRWEGNIKDLTVDSGEFVRRVEDRIG